MRYLLLVFVLLTACRKPVDPGARYVVFTTQPTLKNALGCVATYDEFCTAFHYPNGQRNRQWIQRQRLVTARKFRAAYTDAMLNEPLLRKLTRYKKPRCSVKKTQVVIVFTGKQHKLQVQLDSCRITPAGRLLPSVFTFHIKKAHPKGVN